MDTKTAVGPIFVVEPSREDSAVWLVIDRRTGVAVDDAYSPSQARELARGEEAAVMALEASGEPSGYEDNQTATEAISVALKAPHVDNRRENYTELASSAPSEAGRAFWAGLVEKL